MNDTPKAVAKGRRVAMVVLALAVALTALGVIALIGILAAQPVAV